MPILFSLRRMFGSARSGEPTEHRRDLPVRPTSLLNTVVESEAKRHAASTCFLVIEDREAAIDSDPNLSKLRSLHKLQRLTLQQGQTRNGECAIRIVREPGVLVGILTGPDAVSICEAIRSCGQAWGRVLGSGSTGTRNFRVDLILFWCNGPHARSEGVSQERAA